MDIACLDLLDMSSLDGDGPSRIRGAPTSKPDRAHNDLRHPDRPRRRTAGSNTATRPRSTNAALPGITIPIPHLHRARNSHRPLGAFCPPHTLGQSSCSAQSAWPVAPRRSHIPFVGRIPTVAEPLSGPEQPFTGMRTLEGYPRHINTWTSPYWEGTIGTMFLVVGGRLAARTQKTPTGPSGVSHQTLVQEPRALGSLAALRPLAGYAAGLDCSARNMVCDGLEMETGTRACARYGAGGGMKVDYWPANRRGPGRCARAVQACAFWPLGEWRL